MMAVQDMKVVKETETLVQIAANCATVLLHSWMTVYLHNTGRCTSHVQIKSPKAPGEGRFLVSHLMDGTPNSSHHRG